MALELQLNTAKAASNLQKATQAVEKFGSALGKLGQQAGAAQAIAKSLGSIKGINPKTVTDVTKLSTALAKLKSIGTLGTVVASLNKLGRVNVQKAAKGVQTLGAALAKLRVPSGLSNLIKLMGQLAPAAQKASTSVRQLGGSLARIRPPGGLNAIVNQLRNVSQAANKTRSSIRGIGSATSSVTGLLAGFGIALGGVGMAQFIKGAFEATRTIDGFKSAMTAFKEEGVVAEQQLERIAKNADRLGIALEPSINSFKKFAAAALSAGVDLDTTNQTFENFQTVAAALKLSGDAVGRVFLALEQTFSKGRVASEELRRQLGEVIPGAFQAAAEAAHMTGAEFSKALQKGQIPASLMIKLGQDLADKYREAAKVASTTFIAAVTRMTNSVFKMQEAFGRGLGDAMKDSVNALAKAIDTPVFLGFVKTIGTIVGTLATLATKVATVATQFPILAGAIAAVIGTGLATTVLKWIIILSGVGKVLRGVAVVFGIVKGAIMAWAATTTIIGTVSAAVRGLAIGMAVLGAGTLGTVIAFAAAGIALGALLAVITGNITAEEALLKITDGLGQAWDFAQSAANKFLKPLGLLDETAGEVSTEMKKTADSSEKTGTAFGKVANNSESAASALGTVGQNAGSAATGMGKAAGAASQLATQTGSAAKASGTAASNLSKAASSANQAAQAYDKAAAAARRLAQAQREVKASGLQSGGGSASDSFSADGFAKGGIVGRGGTRMGPVHASAFINAPRLAGGTANTSALGSGAIPAILHENEAVVPLAGGSIPVALSSTGQASAGAAQASVETLRVIELLSDINLESGRNTSVLTTFSAQFTEMTRISHDWYHQIINSLTRITGAIETGTTAFLEALTGLESAIGSISVGGGGGGGFGGGGGGFQGNLGDFQSAAATQAASDSARESLRGAQILQIGTGRGVRIYTSPQDRATDERAGLLAQQATGELHRAFQNTPGVKIKTQGGRSTYSVPPEIFDQLPLSIRNMQNVRRIGGGFVKPSPSAFGTGGPGGVSSSFAHGTANTSESGMFGGSGISGGLAVLHPNEAVIPLDGNRKVPVTLKTEGKEGPPGFGGKGVPKPDFLDQVGREEKRMAQQAVSGIEGGSSREGDGFGGEGGGRGVNVFMKIVTPDANSFLENKDQILQTLSSRLSRVKKQFGQKSISADPTSFLRKKEREGS